MDGPVAVLMIDKGCHIREVVKGCCCRFLKFRMTKIHSQTYQYLENTFSK